MPAISHHAAPMPAMPGTPLQLSTLPVSPAPAPGTGGLEDFRSVLGDALGLEDALGEAKPTAVAAHDDATGTDGVAITADTAPVPVQVPPVLPGIVLLLHGSAPMPGLSMPGLDAPAGQGPASGNRFASAQGDAMGLTQTLMPAGPDFRGEGLPGSSANARMPAAAGQARTVPGADTPSAAADAAQKAGAAPLSIPVEDAPPDLPVEATPPGLPVEATPPSLPVDTTSPSLPVGVARSASTGPEPLTHAASQDSRHDPMQPAGADRSWPGLNHSGPFRPHGPLPDPALQAGQAEEDGIALSGLTGHQAAALPAQVAWMAQNRRELAGADVRTADTDAAPPALPADAAADAAAGGRAGMAPVTEMRPAHVQPERVLDIPRHPASMQWREQFVDRVSFLVGDRIQTAELRLHPAEMGPVSIQISISDQLASIVFLAAHEDTRRHIAEALPQLRDMLGGSGVQLGSATVDDHPQHQPQSALPGGSSRQQEDAVATGHAPAHSAARSLQHHLIDTYA